MLKGHQTRIIHRLFGKWTCYLETLYHHSVDLPGSVPSSWWTLSTSYWTLLGAKWKIRCNALNRHSLLVLDSRREQKVRIAEAAEAVTEMMKIWRRRLKGTS